MTKIIPFQIVGRHLRGEFPIWRSIVGGIVLIALVIGIVPNVISYVDSYLNEYFDKYYIVLVGLSFYSVLLLSIIIVWLVGCWRSVIPALKEKQDWKSLLAFFVIAIATFFTGKLMFALESPFRDIVSAMNGDRQWGPSVVALNHEGTEARVQGAITRMTAAMLVDAVRKNGHLKRIYFDSDGGRVDAALEMSEIIRSHKFETAVSKTCSSVCVIPFLAGAIRVIHGQGRLGFHSASFGGMDLAVVNQVEAEEVKNGVSKAFLEKAYSVSSKSMWYPSTKELVAAHAVTKLEPEPTQETGSE